MTAYLLLFISAFGAATLLPFYSEIALVAMLEQGNSALAVWAVATSGNTLGAAVNWVMGKYLLHFESRSWFPFKPDRLHRAQHWFQRWGKWSLLFAWMPVFGDALTFIAGMMKVPFWIFFILTAIGKALRYLVVIGLYLGFVQWW